ncbi:MAG: tryptophan 2,3-dioxygenase [Actinobacteria bacterium]|nr:tryptophan 2,3-dioxygenase [Actinomycetota bacterium]NBQ00540.1 tryptophan 2,3-dioxygenase [Actinomycetota bacterium]NCY10483.1 tryptophan 2,3-dioxygenase [Actinomycetota bacterium]NCZ71939.1 tryptophan 2,3-dioxygenase [Actinomycetota bacterium]NDE26313.1 tryptophan 2,3-dioxygenase [Actinomycetota bacterium]
MSENHEAALTYSSYLKIDELLKLQKPLSEGPEHDELLFIVIHQTYELWFKELIHEFLAAQRSLESGDTHYSLSILGRIRTIMKICVAQIDILETMTPLQFNSFRDRLGASSGFQSAQFRQVEAILGRRDLKTSAHLLPADKKCVEDLMSSPSLWDSALKYVDSRGFRIAKEILNRDFTQAYQAEESVQAALLDLHRKDPEGSLICERLVDIDEGLQEWRYRHVKMVERTIGSKSGTGGSSGAAYLASTLFNPVFPDLWQIRSKF